MATIDNSVRNAMNDGGSSLYNGGSLQLLDGSSNVLAEFTLGSPAWGASANGSKTLNGLPISATGTAAAGTGTQAASARIRNAADTVTLTAGLTVGVSGSGAQVIVDNTNVANGQTVNLDSYSFTISATSNAA